MLKQDTNEALDYYQDITNDTITSVTWAVSPAGPTLGASSQANTSTRCYKRLSGPFREGVTYRLSVVITGASGQKYERTATISIGDRSS